MLLKEFIIHCVHKCPCIWDMTDPNYKNGQKKDDEYQKIASFINNSYGSLQITDTNVKVIWEHLVKQYKVFLDNGKKIPPSGTGASKSTTSKTDYDLFKLMGFLDHKFVSRSPLSSTGIFVNKEKNSNGKRPQTLWDITPQSSLENADLESNSVMPEPGETYVRKNLKSNKDFQQSMKGVIDCVQDLTNVIKANIQKKAVTSNDIYEDKINNFFKNIPSNLRDELMNILLHIIVDALEV